MPARRIPIFLGSQATCDQCGRELADPLAIEEYGRFCSARCFHARGLPLFVRGGGA